ncbi:unnamed protein product [Hermetia illucens]|uniref:Uncharacterized protein n=2 Tax=Hermetia illucens TaxID=343691 RepID=A0A7R8V5V7_HERIL|nr:unnamed protein product [Hermetia illucens]
MRHLRPKDIGLIFDMTVYNDPNKKKESLDFRIQCEKCCIKVPDNSTSCDVAQLVGGNFGSVMPGSTKVVSLVWPTVTLHNRVGSCDIFITSQNKTGGRIKISHTIHFDTTINKQMVTEHVKAYINSVNYTQCSGPDLDPLRNCTPADCEEKYFGQRNFFNTKTNFCEPVPDCSAVDTGDAIYDYTVNECVDVKRIVCQEHIDKMQKGGYDGNMWEPKHDTESFANITHMPLEKYEGNMKTNDVIDVDAKSPWTGILQGFLMIIAALAIYLCISCCTFSLMVLITKRSSGPNNN